MKDVSKLCFLLAFLYPLMVAFDVYCKKILDIFPYPWTLTTCNLGIGVFYVLMTWAIQIRSPPHIQFRDTKSISSVAVLFTVGNILNVISIGDTKNSYNHPIRASEAIFSMVLTSLVLKEINALHVNLSLVSVVLGGAIASSYKSSISWIAILNAIGTTLAVCMKMVYSQNILKTVQSKGRVLEEHNLLSLIIIISFIGLIPFCLVIEGPFIVNGIREAVHTNGISTFLQEFLCCGLIFSLINDISFQILSVTNAVTCAVCNSTLRVVTIFLSMFIFGMRLNLTVFFGSVINLFGAMSFFYYISLERMSKKMKLRSKRKTD
mmetsp:Transcript_25104/g.32434  ORF Transcript_25104/g.32434 Transcript_25104/m.32434 type:complete len:321 (-) Transcript_25104:437-1399(-)